MPGKRKEPKVAVVGPKGFASFRIRGQPLATANGWDCLDVRKQIDGMYDVIWLVKRHGRYWRHVRRHCKYLVCDPLDFWHSPTRARPNSCWKFVYNNMAFDAIVATSPACHWSMRASLKGVNVPIHMLPHQCDYRITPAWYNPDGPIVYAGAKGFVNSYVETIKDACRLIGREFRVNYSQHHGYRVLNGASLVLALRSGRTYRCLFTRCCKPQIKIENAAAMGAPVLCSGHYAETSLHPECQVALPTDFQEEPKRLAEIIERTLSSAPPSMCYRREHFFDDAKRVIELLGTEKEIESYGETMDRKPNPSK